MIRVTRNKFNDEGTILIYIEKPIMDLRDKF